MHEPFLDMPTCLFEALTTFQGDAHKGVHRPDTDQNLLMIKELPHRGSVVHRSVRRKPNGLKNMQQHVRLTLDVETGEVRPKIQRRLQTALQKGLHHPGGTHPVHGFAARTKFDQALSVACPVLAQCRTQVIDMPAIEGKDRLDDTHGSYRT